MDEVRCDLVIRGGTVANAESAEVADVGITGERIVQVGGRISGDREIDAENKLILPGGIDAHVHLTPSEDMLDGPRWCDDFVSGSRAAAAGGVTTVGNMTFPRGNETLPEAIARETAEAERDSVIDVFLHPVLTDPSIQPLSDLPTLWDAGCTSLKFFTSFGGFLTDPASYVSAMRIASELGMLTLVHCEDAAIMDSAADYLRAHDSLAIQYYPQARSVVAEAAATARVMYMAAETGAAVYVVHLSAAAALEEVRRARVRGTQVFVETRPLYLYLTEERFAEPDGAKYVGQPPLRTPADVDALWLALTSGEIDTVCTDHAAWTFADKMHPEMTIDTLRPGVADLETLMPMLFSAGVASGRFPVTRFVELVSTNAARRFGLYPAKGRIAAGTDADLVIWDPNLTRPVSAQRFFSNADYSPYEGQEVTGWPVTTISRGEVVFDAGQVMGRPGRGRALRRGAPDLAG